MEKDAHAPEQGTDTNYADTDTGPGGVEFHVSYEFDAVGIWAIGLTYLDWQDLTWEGAPTSDGFITFVESPDTWRLILLSPEGACTESEEREMVVGDVFTWNAHAYTGTFVDADLPICRGK